MAIENRDITNFVGHTKIISLTEIMEVKNAVQMCTQCLGLLWQQPGLIFFQLHIVIVVQVTSFSQMAKFQ